MRWKDRAGQAIARTLRNLWIAVGTGMQFLVIMPASVSYRAQSWLASPLRTPVGDIELGGQLRNAISIPPGNMRVLHRYTLVLVLDGRGYYVDEAGTRTTFGPGDVLWVFPGVAHAYGAHPDTDWTQVYVVFDGPQFNLWRDAGLLSVKHPVYRLGTPDYWRAQIMGILQSDSLGDTDYAIRALGHFLQLIAEMASVDRSAARGKSQDAWLPKSMRLLGERTPDGWQTPQGVARQVGLSYENFRKRFVRQQGESPARYQMRRRLEQACTAIFHGEHSLKQIAGNMGFCDVFHFSKAFKRQTGLAPSEYRRRVRG